MYYNVHMNVANIVQLRNSIGKYLSLVEQGQEIEVRKRNVPIARIIPIANRQENRTQLGVGIGTGRILGDVIQPFMPESEWEMLSEKEKK